MDWLTYFGARSSIRVASFPKLSHIIRPLLQWYQVRKLSPLRGKSYFLRRTGHSRRRRHRFAAGRQRRPHRERAVCRRWASTRRPIDTRTQARVLAYAPCAQGSSAVIVSRHGNRQLMAIPGHWSACGRAWHLSSNSQVCSRLSRCGGAWADVRLSLTSIRPRRLAPRRLFRQC